MTEKLAYERAVSKEQAKREVHVQEKRRAQDKYLDLTVSLAEHLNNSVGSL